MKKFLLIIIVIILSIGGYLMGCTSVIRENSENLYMRRIMDSKNFNGKKFVNLSDTPIGHPGTTGNTIMHWITGDEVREPEYKLKNFNVNLKIYKNQPPSGLRVTWLGHSIVLIEIDGKRFLTDPMWSRRASPFKAIGPARFFKVPIELGDLPPLDGIIISHDHYDHLDEATIRKLKKRNVPFYTPLGVGKHLYKWGIPKERIKEMDWGDSIRVGKSHRIIATPARHFSGRSITRRNRTLWASFVIQGPQHKVYFSGDSGYFSGFKEIGKEHGPFDLTIIEVGAYHPNWDTVHLGPENALKAHKDLRGKIMLPIHWGTFQLAMHGWTEPAEQLMEMAQKEGISLSLPQPGQALVESNLTFNSRWWEPENKIIDQAVVHEYQ